MSFLIERLFLLDPVMARFLIAETIKLRHRTALQLSMFTIMPSLNPFWFPLEIKGANTEGKMFPVWNLHCLHKLFYIVMFHKGVKFENHIYFK